MKKLGRFNVLVGAFLAAAIFLLGGTQAAPASARVKYNFNLDWKVLVGDARGAEAEDYNDSAWKSVPVPYAWNQDDAFRKDIKDLSTGVAWYRKHFRLPADSAGKKIFLEFERIRQGGEFYLNGKWIGRHENKNVYLHLTDRLYQTLPLYSNLNTIGVYVYAQEFDLKNCILAKSLPVEGGIKRVIVRSKTEPGKIVLSASSAALKSATIEMISRPLTLTGGLLLMKPPDNLTSYLGRDPTPTGDALTATRTAVPITSATAGANNEHVGASFDDNEVNSWSSEGKLATGWIKYELARVATVSEVTFRLGGWRTRSYPVAIGVDDKVVFTGRTARSLGYVTIKFPPTKGKSLKIQLTGDMRDETPGNIAELGQKDAEPSGDQSAAKSKREIVEIEIYEPACGKPR